MSKFKEGDRVVFSGEGVVDRVDRYYTDAKEKVYVRRDGDGRTNIFGPESLMLIEPEYEDGAMYVDNEGSFFAYWPHRGAKTPWVEPGSHASVHFDDPVRPLRKLVPES